jgi:hypothetical protein
VAATANLRLVFHWDEGSGWKYHDCGIMPFPPQSSQTLDAALSLKSVTPLSDISSHPPELTYQGDISDEDSYWDSYGATDDAEGEQAFGVPSSETVDNSEDAYWALYGKVQGWCIFLYLISCMRSNSNDPRLCRFNNTITEIARKRQK